MRTAHLAQIREALIAITRLRDVVNTTHEQREYEEYYHARFSWLRYFEKAIELIQIRELFIVIFGSLFVSVGLFGTITEAIKQAKKR